MDLTALLIILILAGAAGLIVSRPLYMARDNKTPLRKETVNELAGALTAQKEKNLDLIRDLETDRLHGKISPADFNTVREQLFLETALIAENLEEAQKSPQAGEAENRISSSENSAVNKKYCPACGKEARPEDVFCSGCGKKIDAG